MHRWLAALLLLLFVSSTPAQTDKAFRHKVLDASLPLFYADPDDRRNDNMTACHATAFKKDEKQYYLVTAAHCVLVEHNFLIKVTTAADNGTLSVALGMPSKDRKHIPVKIYAVGNPKTGWDIAILTASLDANLPVMPLGDETKLEPGDKVVAGSAPWGGDIKFYFEGQISALNPQINPDMQTGVYKNIIYAQIPFQSGSSGTAIISPDQQAIVGVGVAMLRYETQPFDILSVMIVPASAIKTFFADPKGHSGIMPADKAP